MVKEIAQENNDTVWQKETVSFYKKRHKQANKVKKQLLRNKHENFCEQCFKKVDFSRTDIQTILAGINTQNLLGINNLILISEIEVYIKKNKLGILYQKKFIPANYLTDVYCWSNVLKAIDYKLSKKDKKIVSNYQKRFLKNKNLRIVYEWIITTLNTEIISDKSMIKPVLERFTNENNLFFRLVKNKKQVTIDSIYNGLVLQMIALGEIIKINKNAAQNWLNDHTYLDGFRSSQNHHPNMWHQYNYFCCRKLLNYDLTNKEKQSIISYLLSCQCPNGGFYSSVHGKDRTLSRTLAALLCLKILGMNLQGRFYIFEGFTTKK